MEIDKTTAYEGKDGKIRWEQRADETLDGLIDFASIFGLGDSDRALMDREQPNLQIDTVLAYAWTTVSSPDERQARIWTSTLNPAKVWCNGEEISTINPNQQSVLSAEHSVLVTLRAGENSILVKLNGWLWGWGFHLWLTDVDGFPFEDLEFINSPTVQESVEE